MRGFILKVMGLLLLVPALAFSQTFQGGVRGAVRDADGGVLPGTTVTLTNSQTGAVRTSVTNERGEYVFASVAPGTYNLAVEISGFAPFHREGLEVGVQTFLVQDVSLQVGGIAESVTVTGETPLIETANASIASAIDKAQLDVLPTPGRNVFIYAVTTPNVVHTGDPVFVRKQDQTNSSLLSLAGGPLRANNYTVDGVSVNDMRNRAVIIPNNDAVEEMKVQVNTYDAEMGRTGGGVFNVLHKSGTNNWGGSALWQTRPQFGRGLLWFEETDHGGSGEAPESPYDLWSFAGGGPIFKDKTFFWASYEGYKNTDTAERQHRSSHGGTARRELRRRSDDLRSSDLQPGDGNAVSVPRKRHSPRPDRSGGEGHGGPSRSGGRGPHQHDGPPEQHCERADVQDRPQLQREVARSPAPTSITSPRSRRTPSTPTTPEAPSFCRSTPAPRFCSAT